MIGSHAEAIKQIRRGPASYSNMTATQGLRAPVKTFIRAAPVRKRFLANPSRRRWNPTAGGRGSSEKAQSLTIPNRTG